MMVGKLWLSMAALLTSFAAAQSPSSQCSPSNIESPSIPNARVLDLAAAPVTEYPYEDSTLDFCNVTVTYTHPGWDDTIHVTVWLPLSGWSGRLQGSGGGEFAMRKDDEELAKALALHYTVVATDGGHQYADMTTSKSWALDENDKVNMALLKDFAYVGLNDAAIVGKSAVNSFYGRKPDHSYWNGCSTGGRQGLMLAQRYPTAYDGILAGAPAINWPTFLVTEFWPQVVMNTLGRYTPKCITDAITDAAVKACDNQDGVVDNVIGAPDMCDFDPFTVVGQQVDCNGTSVPITKEDATIVQKAWEGLRSPNGSFVWYGLEKGAPLSQKWNQSMVATDCSKSGGSPSDCTGLPFPPSEEWISLFVLENPSIDMTTLRHEDLVDIVYDSKARYDSIIGTDDPDLSGFKEAGGKMITWHGLADELIFPKGTEQYYNRVEAKDSDVRDYYRFFQAPGVHHCREGSGPIPEDPLSDVIAWVEQGVKPETIHAVTLDGERERDLCQYPLVSVYKGGDPKVASSYACQEKFD